MPVRRRPPGFRQELHRRYVPGSGPLEADLLFIGEAPGENEAKKATPFVGITGQVVRDMLTKSGIDLSRVRFNNAVPYWIDVPSNQHARMALIEKYREHLEEELTYFKGKVIVACGGVALMRLRGLVPAEHDQPTLDIGAENGMVYPTVNGPLLIPCRHPAGVMRSKLQAHRMSVGKAIERACSYATKQIVHPGPYGILRGLNILHNPGVDVLREALGQSAIAIDTEFERDTYELTSVQLSYGAPTESRRSLPHSTTIVLDRSGLSDDVIKMLRAGLGTYDARRWLIGHNHTSELKSLNTIGVSAPGPWFDTMTAFGRLYPDLEEGLNDAAAFYFDHLWNWKTRRTDDLAYRALDSHLTLHLYYEERREIAEQNMHDLIYDETFPTATLLWGLTERGMHVDPLAQAKLNTELSGEMAKLFDDIRAVANGIYEKRIEQARGEERAIEDAVLEAKRNRDWHYVPCSVKKHEIYDGMKKKKFSSNPDCTCASIYEAAANARENVGVLKKPRGGLRTKIKRWSNDMFDPGNNDHMRWLLYDKNALDLPVKRNRETGQPTADSDAIDKLLSSKEVAASEIARTLIVNIKKYQHLGKMKSTFANPKVDDEGYAHPPMRISTGTGRVASGEGASGDEDSGSEYAFNVLNYPKEMRVIFDG